MALRVYSSCCKARPFESSAVQLDSVTEAAAAGRGVELWRHFHTLFLPVYLPSITCFTVRNVKTKCEEDEEFGSVSEHIRD